MAERSGWLLPALCLVAALTGMRLLALAWGQTDLFVDESQYWLWAQNLDSGYYSKPPLIAWLIRGVTTLAGSDAVFWVRMPGAVLHGGTALILGALAARIFGAMTALWVVASYLTAPFVALGSLLISTDTIMLPCFALGLWAYFKVCDTGRLRFGVLTGVGFGLGVMAKYVAVFGQLGVGLAALLYPRWRIGWRMLGVIAAVFVVVIAPNIIWNLRHDLTTVSHTMDNAGWVRGPSLWAHLNLGSMAGFFAAQFAVLGPIMFGALLFGLLRPEGARTRQLALFVAPVVVLFCVQALMMRAYANWGVVAYAAGSVIAVRVLLTRWPRGLWLSLWVNGVVCVLLPLLTVLAPMPVFGDKPLLARYLGRAALSHQILDLAQAQGAVAVLAQDRDVLADLFYTGRDTTMPIYAPRPTGRPRSYYEQQFPLPMDLPGPILFITAEGPICAGQPLAAVARLDTQGGAYARRDYRAYLVGDMCRDAL